jgi:hypothetical protein
MEKCGELVTVYASPRGLALSGVICTSERIRVIPAPGGDAAVADIKRNLAGAVPSKYKYRSPYVDNVVRRSYQLRDFDADSC